MTRNEWKNELSKKSRAPKWIIESIWSDADIDELLEAETNEEYLQDRMTFKEDVDLWIENLERIKKMLPTMAFDKD